MNLEFCLIKEKIRGKEKIATLKANQSLSHIIVLYYLRSEHDRVITDELEGAKPGTNATSIGFKMSKHDRREKVQKNKLHTIETLLKCPLYCTPQLPHEANHFGAERRPSKNAFGLRTFTFSILNRTPPSPLKTSTEYLLLFRTNQL